MTDASRGYLLLFVFRVLNFLASFRLLLGYGYVPQLRQTPTTLLCAKKEPFWSLEQTIHYTVCGDGSMLSSPPASLFKYTLIFTSHSLLLCCPLAPTMVSNSSSLTNKIRTLAPLTLSTAQPAHTDKLAAGPSSILLWRYCTNSLADSRYETFSS